MPIYREIRLFDDTEISLGFIWKKLYERLHRSFVPLKDPQGFVPVGLTFPKYGGEFPLGDRARIFAPDEKTMNRLHLDRILDDLGDYIDLSPILQTPDAHTPVRYRRKQFKTNPLRQARRYAKRHNIGYDEALQRYASFDTDAIIKKNKLPFVNFRSSSTGQKTRIFIQKETPQAHQKGLFSTFGLSKGATLPDF